MRETTATPTTTSKTDPVAAQRTVARSIGLLTFSRMVFNIASRMTYPFLSVFAVGLGVDLHALSQVMVVRSATGFLSPFLASLADLWGHKRGVIIGTAICLLANLAVVLFPVYGVFFAAMSLTFLGMYFFMASMQAYVGEIVPFERRGMALAITETGWGLAFVVGMPVLGFLIRRWGWLSPFWLLTTLSALSLLLLWRLLPAGAKHPASGDPAAQAKAFVRNLRQVFTSRTAVYLLLMALLMVTANELVNLVFGVWIEESFGLSVTGLGAAALALGVMELVGELSGGAAADRFGKGRAVVMGIVLNILAAVWMAFFAKTLPGAIIGLTLFYLSFEFAIVAAIGLVSEALPTARATMMGAVGASLSLGRMLGAMAVPYLYSLGFVWNLIITVLVNAAAIGAVLLALKTGAFHHEPALPTEQA